MVDGSQEVLLEEVERLAANQHARLEELQQSSGVVEAALRSLRHGDPRLARQVLKSQTCSDTARSGRSEPDEAVSSRGRAPGWPPPPRTAWSGGSSPTDRETPPPEYAPVWGRIPGAEEMWASPKEPKASKGSTDADDQQSAPSCVKRGDPQDADRERRRGEIPDHFVGPGTTVMGRSSSHGNLKDPAFLGRHRRHGAGGPPRIHGFVGHEREDICPGDFGWLGAGRRHFSTKDHMLAAGMSSGQASPKGKKLMPAQDHLQSGWAVHIPPEHEVRHGRQREAAFHNGLERFIGHGRRHRPEWVQKDNPFRPIQDATPGPRRRPVGGADHIVPGCGQASCLEDASPVGRRHFGARDNIRPGFAFDKTHSEGSIGYGRQRIQEKAHLLGGLSRAADCPGQHGHARDDDFQDGIERGIGHGKRRLRSGFEAVQAEAGKTCFRCGNAFQADLQYCKECGHKRGEAMFPLAPRPPTPTDQTTAAGAPSALCRTAPPRCSHPKMW